MVAWILTDEQWLKISAFIPNNPKSPLGGRPRASDRKSFQGILWVLRTGAQWAALPNNRKLFASRTTCWRRLHEWTNQGIFLSIFRNFLAELNANSKIDWEESFIDGTFASAKKGVRRSAKQNVGKDQR